MIVKYSIFGYLIGEGFRNFFKNKKSTAASLIIMCATMFIFGIFFLIGENVNYIIEQVQSDQAMQIFINPEATDEQEKELESKIRGIQYVNTVDYVSQEQALNDMKSWLGEDSSLLDPYSGEENPFKAFLDTMIVPFKKLIEEAFSYAENDKDEDHNDDEDDEDEDDDDDQVDHEIYENVQKIAVQILSELQFSRQDNDTQNAITICKAIVKTAKMHDMEVTFSLAIALKSTKVKHIKFYVKEICHLLDL